MRAVPLLVACALLAGCGSSPATRFLTLDVAAGAVHAGYRGPPVSVPAVHVPALLDRPEFAQEVSAGQAQVSDFNKWIAPLGTLARDTLVRDLAARLPAGTVLPPGTPAAGARAVRVDATVLAFDGQAGVMQFGYAMVMPGRPPVRRLLQLHTAGGPDPQAAARAFSALLGQAADAIAVDLDAGGPAAR